MQIRIAITAILLSVLCLTCLGLVMIYSATVHSWGFHYLFNQLAVAVVGWIGLIALWRIDYRRLKKIQAPWLLYGLALLGLLLILVGLGETRNGSTRWFVGIGGQPSDIAKIAVIIALARYMEKNEDDMKRFIPGIVIPFIIIGLPCLLIIAEPDFSTCLLVGAVGVCMMFAGGSRMTYLGAITGILAIAFVGIILTNGNRSTRIDAWLNPENHARGAAYQTDQSKSALAMGGIDGRGLGEGLQSDYVPERSTDFILAVVGEEFGLRGTLLVACLYMLILVSGIFLAVRSHDKFGHLLAFGMAFLIFLQAFINMSVVTGLLPNTGIPLPFMSYGRTNALFMLLGVGFLLSIGRVAFHEQSQDQAPVFKEGEPVGKEASHAK